MDTAIVLSEQSTSQVTFTSMCGESSSTDLRCGLPKNGNGIEGSSCGYSITKNGGTLPRKTEPEGPSSVDTLSRSQKLESSESAGGKLRGDEAERRYKLCLRAEIVGLCVVIVIVWGLLLLPIVFYHLPLASDSENNRTAPAPRPQSCDMEQKLKYTGVCSSRVGTGRQSMTCASPVTYTESVCQEELKSIKDCLLSDGDGESVHPLVATDSNLKSARSILSYVNDDSLGLVSPACAAEVKPFLCLYFFGLCDTTEGVSYQPSASHCRDLRDSVCASEWEAVTILGQFRPDIPTLPNCDLEFSDVTVLCNSDAGSGDEGNITDGTFGSGMPSSSPTSAVQQETTLTCKNITCREGFYCREGAAVCIPSCHTWNQYPRATNIAIDFLVLTAACIGMVTGVGVLVVAGLRWKKVLVFPSSLAVYQTITLLVLAFFVIVNYMDNSTLYCTSENLFESLEKATPFCVITGVVFYYSLLQLAVFWLCHVLALFWKIKFPFHSRSFQMAHRTKYVHIAAVALSIFVPFIPVVATMSQYGHKRSPIEAAAGGLGFGITRFPPLLCTGRHSDTTFYSLILPILVILMVGMTFLLIIFVIIHRQHGLFKARQSKNPYKIGTAERKILIVFVYYIILAVIALTAFTLTIRDEEEFSSAVLRYFECESKGVDPDNPCDPSSYIKLLHIALTSLSYILLGLFPMINFIFVISVRELKQYMRKQCPFLFKRPRRKASKFQLSDTPSSTTSTQTGTMLPSTPQTPRDKKHFIY